jgi:hypothetical protein
MDQLQRTPITLEVRKAMFQLVEQNMHNTEPLKFTLFLELQLITAIGFGVASALPFAAAIMDGLAGWGAWRYVLATLGAIAAGLVVLIVAFALFEMVFGWPFTRRRFRKIKGGSNEELWNIANCPYWNCWATVALTQLAARGEDVSGVLPRIIRMLDTSEYTERRQAFDAIRLVFLDEARAIEDYNPKSSYGDCRAKVARLKELLGQTPPEPSNAASEPTAVADPKTVRNP